MDCIDRLIQRALAQPRGAETALFDPFERVAGWPLDTPPGAVSKAAPGTPFRHTSALAEPARPVAPRAPPALEVRAPAALSSPPRRLAPEPAPAMSRTETTSEPTPTPQLHAYEAPPPTARSAETLARADAFMRTLGVPGVTAAPSAQATKAAVKTTLSTVVPAPGAAAPGTPARATPRPSARLQPPAPPRVAAAPVSTRPARPATAPQTAAAAPPARTPRRETPAPVVQTTLVVAPAARTLDDLAHSAGIVRFGLGQL